MTCNGVEGEGRGLIIILIMGIGPDKRGLREREKEGEKEIHHISIGAQWAVWGKTRKSLRDLALV